jgi:hypothetical protein
MSFKATLGDFRFGARRFSFFLTMLGWLYVFQFKISLTIHCIIKVVGCHFGGRRFLKAIFKRLASEPLFGAYF